MDSVMSTMSTYMTPTVQIVLMVLTVLAIRAFFARRRQREMDNEEAEEVLPPLEKQDFTLEELKEYNGVSNPRILIAVNGKVFDVTRGKGFYGPGFYFFQFL